MLGHAGSVLGPEVSAAGFECVSQGCTACNSIITLVCHVRASPVKPLENLGSLRGSKALSLSARASPLRVLGFLRRSALRRWSRSVSRPHKDSYDSSARPMGVASKYSTLPCAIATFPVVSLPLSSPGNIWPRYPLLPSTRP